MSCLYCAAPTTTELPRTTTLGYRMFRCRVCRRTCNERTGTPFNHLQVPTDIAQLVVLWRLPVQAEPAQHGRDVPHAGLHLYA